MAGVEIRKVRKSFGRVDVIHGIDLTVKDGEFVVLVGPSGCGKSTLLRMIAGLEGVSDGEIAIGGKVVNDLPPRSRDIAMVFQDYALYPHKTVCENMAFGLRMRGTPKPEIEKLVVEGGGHPADRPPDGPKAAASSRAASGSASRWAAPSCAGLRSSCSTSRSPTSTRSCGPRCASRSRDFISSFGTTIVYVTHDQIEAMTLADRIAIMKGGHLQQYDTPDTCYVRPHNRFVAGFIGAPPMNFAQVAVADDATSIGLGNGVRAMVTPQARAESRPRQAAT